MPRKSYAQYSRSKGKRARGRVPSRKHFRAMSGYNPQKAISSRQSPFPTVMHTKFTYGDTISLTSTTGSVATHTFAASGMYDPDITATGHQPRFFDTLLGAAGGSQPYGSYQVFGCKLQVRFASATISGSPSSGTVWVATRTSSANAITDLAQAREQKRVQRKPINTLTSGSNNVTWISRYVPIHTVWGLSKEQLDPSEYGGSYNANPQNPAYIDIQYADELGASSSVRAEVKMTYYVKLYNANDVAQS